MDIASTSANAIIANPVCLGKRSSNSSMTESISSVGMCMYIATHKYTLVYITPEYIATKVYGHSQPW